MSGYKAAVERHMVRLYESLSEKDRRRYAAVEAEKLGQGGVRYSPTCFCHVSRVLQAVVLKTIQVAQDFIGRTKTATGLRVVAEIARRTYEKGLKATRDFRDNNPIRFDDYLPELNYTASWVSML